jgi:hypothetical protein
MDVTVIKIKILAMNKIRRIRLERQRLGQITNEYIIPGDLYEMNWRKKRGGLIIIATYGIPKNKKYFCGTVVSVPDDNDCPVGVHLDNFLVADAKWVHPRIVTVLKNN